MKLPSLFVAAVIALASPAFAQHDHDAKPGPASKAAENYPLTTCVVSNEKLGGMGKPVEVVHREAGKPDRVVLLCCESCIDDFKAAPAKYLKKIDEAAAAAKAKK